MQVDQLREDYETLCKILQRERHMRSVVLAGTKRERGIAEINSALAIVVRWKDALKPHCGRQERLFE